MALRRLAPAVWSLRLQAAAQQAAPAFAVPALLRGFASGEAVHLGLVLAPLLSFVARSPVLSLALARSRVNHAR
jgi:hypothetical protein